MRFGYGNKAQKKALVSYVKFLPIDWHGYYCLSHSNKLASRGIVESLVDIGYMVDLTDCSDDLSNIDLSEYDLFIGHTNTFSKIASRLKPNVGKILLLTGSNPVFGNKAQADRAAYLKRRKGIDIELFEENIVSLPEDNFLCSDRILLMGNSTVLETYPENFQQKIILINNVSPFTSLTTNHKKRSNSFLFMSSIGQVHRGLDILLDVFQNRSEDLIICSDYEKEQDFMEFYSRIIFENKNIIPMGYVNTTESKLTTLADMATFAILPSCSEGQSSSILNLMRKGLIPIATQNVGLPDLASYGYVIEDCTVEGLSSLIEEIVNAPLEEILEKQKRLLQYSELFSFVSFKDQIKKALTSSALK